MEKRNNAETKTRVGSLIWIGVKKSCWKKEEDVNLGER